MRVTHLYHSGFLIEFDGCALLFDWFPETAERTAADIALLPRTGTLYVFSSHEHHDHYTPAIWTLPARLPGVEVTFIVDQDVAALAPAGNDLDIVSCEPEEIYEIDERMEVTTLESTDEGIAFLVEVLGRTIYHAGDLNIWWWLTRDTSLNVLSEQHFRYFLQVIEGKHVELAMLPLDTRPGLEGDRGVEVFMQLIGADVVAPMHYQDDRAGAEALADSARLAPWRDRIRFDDSFDL